MLRGKVIALLILCLVFALNAWAGDATKAPGSHHMVILTPEMEAKWALRFSNDDNPAPFFPTNNRGFSDVIGMTGYDYGTNSVTARMLARTSPDNVHIVYMDRDVDGGSRFVTYNYFDASIPLLFGPQSIDEALGTTGWGRVANGKNDEAIVAGHGGGTWLYSDASQAGYSFTPLHPDTFVLAGNFPGIALNPATDEIWYVGDSNAGGSFTPDSFYYSNDYGATFTPMTFPSTVIISGGIPGNVECWPILNPANTSEVGMTFTEEDPAGVHPGALSWHVTSDNGATWNSTALYEETQWFSDPAGNYNYLVQNFSQLNNMYTDDGTVHIAFNGYGLVDSANVGDTLAIFPIVYWNSNTQQFRELTDPSVGHNIDDDFSTAILGGFPGNGIGNAYPTMATGPNNELVVLWQQVEVDANGMPIIAPDTLGNPSGFYATDVWGAYSDDNGQSWSAPFFVTGRPDMSDAFPVLAREMSADADSIWLDYVYYQDADPGVSLFGEGGFQVAPWVFERTAFAKADIPTGIDDPTATIIDGFSLRQNYPNPFNPVTTIEFTLPQASEVTLVVYNTLGQKVATLTDGKMTAGTHEVEFDGKDFASGLYFYKLSTDDVSIAKKMILMK